MDEHLVNKLKRPEKCGGSLEELCEFADEIHQH
jgi:hypothetical protein